MDTLMSLPMTASVLTEYGDLEEACRSCGCDGLEVVWGGEELPCTVPQALHVGYHLTFYPDWLDFWRGDRAALTEKFGSEEVWRSFYGGPEGRETLLRLYREDLDRAVTWGARYVVFHVSDVSVEEGFTYHWRHTHEEVIDAAAEVINLVLGDRAWPFDFLVENQWWPGFTFTEPELTRRLLDGIRAERKGIMLDIGHLMNCDTSLRTLEEGADYVHRMLDRHGGLCRYIRGIHLHCSLSGEYVRAHTGFLPPGLPLDYLKRYGFGYRHILRIDTHQPWTSPAICEVVERIGPDYLVHELSAPDRGAREEAIHIQKPRPRTWIKRRRIHSDAPPAFYQEKAPQPKGYGALAAAEGFEPSHTESESAVLPLHKPAIFTALCEHACYYTKMAQNVNRKMKKIWKEKLGRGGAPAHGSKSELVGLVVLVLSLLLLLVLSILAIGLVLTILAAGLHLVRILILHQAHLAFADCSVPGKNKIIRKFFSQMGIPRAALLCYNEPS